MKHEQLEGQVIGDFKSAGPKSNTSEITEVWDSLANVDSQSGWEIVGLHLYNAYRAVLAAPFTTLMTVLSMVMALVIIGFSWLVFRGFLNVVGPAGEPIRGSVYLADNIDGARLKEIDTLLRGLKEVASIEFKSKSQAFRELKSELQHYPDILSGLDPERFNPLPPSFEIVFGKNVDSIAELDLLAQDLRRLPEIEDIQFNRRVLTVAQKSLKAARVVGITALTFLIMLAAFLVTTTIRLALYSHKDEIEIMKLVGATPGWIRAPYLIEGAIQGLLGGLLAFLILTLGANFMEQFLRAAQIQEYVNSEMLFLSWSLGLVLVVVGVILGIFGSYIALKQFQSDLRA